jgi:hypothetical protein
MAKKSTNSKTVAKTVAIVSSDKIFFGVFFPLRQAWELLSAATALQVAGKFSSAYGLAVFCRQEIGKSLAGRMNSFSTTTGPATVC